MWNPDLYQNTLLFAGKAHLDQKLPGSPISYLAHIAAVCSETMHAVLVDTSRKWDVDFAMQCALLHDVVEDTKCSLQDIDDAFGERVAEGVWALTKDEELPKEARMEDSLSKILGQPDEIRVVKLADRTCNLKKPPFYWKSEKIKAYQLEAKMILERLGGVNKVVEDRLRQRMESYQKFI
ncbi:MAG: HD domain-containing protein [Saprospiraceae bacterium]|nr:HD domain-containing protein [Saprospiraceae bacterium]